MKCVLMITGDTKVFGNGHLMRMNELARELKRRQLAVVHMTAAPDVPLKLPLEVAVYLLDRRDTDFNPIEQPRPMTRIAIDNRGQARNEADLDFDLLPHYEMVDEAYQQALNDILLPAALTRFAAATKSARLTLHETAEAAEARADFVPVSGRLSPQAYLQRLLACERPAVYFGQALFEALYAGKDVQLYPVSEYHSHLSRDLLNRMRSDSNLLTALDGSGLKRLADRVQREFKKRQEQL